MAIAAGDLAAARAAYQAAWTSRPGWPPPTPPTPDGSATCPSATTSSGTWRSRPGTWPPPAPPTRPPGHRGRLAAADPANTEWQRDLSVSHNKLGDVAAAAGDLAAARAAYQAALDIARPAGRRRPRQHRMAARPVRQPRTSSATWRSRPGTWPPPAPPTRPASTSRARLAAADPANTEWQRDLSVSHNKLGDVAAAAGDLAAARAAYQAALDIARPAGRRRPRQHRMAARPVRQPRTSSGTSRPRPGTWPPPAPPTRPAWTSPPGWPPPTPPTPNGSATCPSATTSSGTWRSRPGTWPPPATAYQAALDIADRLAAADPANTEWQRDLSVSHNKLGDLATAAGDLAAARTAYQAALDIADRLAAADPANTEWQRDLELVRQKISSLDG